MLTSFIGFGHQPFDEFERLWIRLGSVDHGPVEHLGRDARHLSIPLRLSAPLLKTRYCLFAAPNPTFEFKS